MRPIVLDMDGFAKGKDRLADLAKQRATTPPAAPPPAAAPAGQPDTSVIK